MDLAETEENENENGNENERENENENGKGRQVKMWARDLYDHRSRIGLNTVCLIKGIFWC